MSLLKIDVDTSSLRSVPMFSPLESRLVCYYYGTIMGHHVTSKARSVATFFQPSYQGDLVKHTYL